MGMRHVLSFDLTGQGVHFPAVKYAGLCRYS